MESQKVGEKNRGLLLFITTDARQTDLPRLPEQSRYTRLAFDWVSCDEVLLVKSNISAGDASCGWRAEAKLCQSALTRDNFESVLIARRRSRQLTVSCYFTGLLH